MTAVDYWIELEDKLDDIRYLASKPDGYWNDILVYGEAMKNKALLLKHIKIGVPKYSPDEPIYSEHIIRKMKGEKKLSLDEMASEPKDFFYQHKNHSK